MIFFLFLFALPLFAATGNQLRSTWAQTKRTHYSKSNIHVVRKQTVEPSQETGREVWSNWFFGAPVPPASEVRRTLLKVGK